MHISMISSRYLSGAGSVKCNDEAEKESCLLIATTRLLSAIAQLFPDIDTS